MNTTDFLVDLMSTTLERLQYGYDRDSRRTWRRRALTTGEDNAYGYDGLSQVTQSALGTLNQNCTAIGAVPTGEENWDYDPTGNWRGYRVEADGSVALDQSRVHDKGNRLTQIEDDPYPVLLDRVGRVRQISPGADGDWDESQKIKWDAWGRVTETRRTSDNTRLGSYAYDGLTRRTTRTVAGTTHHCYYSDQWRPLEERKNSQTTAEMQYYWGARHRDDLVRRDRATTDGGTLDETRYVLMDYYSPAAIVDETGTVMERYAFSAFGIRRILTPEFVPRSSSECGFEFGFQGQFFDTESGFLNYGYRYYSPHIGRWLSKDPIEEDGGSNLLEFAENNPVDYVDLLGLETQPDISWQPPPCVPAKCLDTRFVQLVTPTKKSWHPPFGWSLTPPFLDGLVDGMGPFYFPDKIGYTHAFTRPFEDSPSGLNGSPVFEVCRACVKINTIIIDSIGPCKIWKQGDKGDLDNPRFETTPSASNVLVAMIVERFPDSVQFD